MKCTAKKSSGDPCKNWAIKGAKVCKNHGGRAPQVKAKAGVRILETRIAGELKRREITPVTSPLAALQEVAGLSIAWMDAMQDELGKLAILDYSDAKAAEDVKPVVALFERSMDRAASVLAKMVQLGIEDRVAKSAELEAEANLAAMRGLIRAARQSPGATEDELILGLLAGTVKA